MVALNKQQKNDFDDKVLEMVLGRGNFTRAKGGMEEERRRKREEMTSEGIIFRPSTGGGVVPRRRRMKWIRKTMWLSS